VKRLSLLFALITVTIAITLGTLIGTFLTWTVDREYEVPIGCGGCSYVQYLQEGTKAFRDAFKHISKPGKD
jgi:hypothetical protein